MNLLQKMHNKNNLSQLPSISLNKLQENFLNNKKSMCKLVPLTKETDNIKQFKVTSPFYDRMATHKQNCKCPYHKRKRMEIMPVKGGSKNQNSENYSHLRNSRKSSNLNHLFNDKQNSKNRGFSKLSDDQNLFRYTYQDKNTKGNWIGAFSKTDTKNQGFQYFLKQYQLLMLQKNGFNGGKPAHLVKKGVKQIFQFIKTHLDYSVQKMKTHIQKQEKDRDFNDFYIQRFIELKNLWPGRKSPKTSQSLTHKNNLPKNKKLQRIQREPQEKYKKVEQIPVITKHKRQSKLTLTDVIQHIKKNGVITAADIKQFLDCDLDLFKSTFNDFNKDIQNGKYDEAFLKKLQKKFFEQLLHNTNVNPLSQNAEDAQQFLQKKRIIQESHQILKKILNKHKNHKSQSPNSTSRNLFISKSRRATQLQRTSIYDANHLKKQSQRPSQHSQSEEKQSKIHIDHPSDQQIQNETSHKNMNDLICITEQSNSNIENEEIFKIKSSSDLFRNSRRSKLLGRESFGKSSFLNLSQLQQDQEFKSKKFIDSQKGGLKKAQKFLYQANLGGIVVKQDDSIITAKRKLRVIRTLLKQNQKIPQSQELKQYMKIIQERIKIKIQKKRQSDAVKSKVKPEPNDQGQIDFSKLLGLDIFGYKLIFYDLSALVNFQDFDDLCLMLNQISLTKKLSSKVSYRWINEQQEQVKQVKNHDDELIQTDFKDPLFYQVQKSDQNLRSNQKMTSFFDSKGMGQSKLSWKITNQTGSYLNQQQIKKAFMFAKQNLPETFKTYVKNSSYHAESKYI